MRLIYQPPGGGAPLRPLSNPKCQLTLRPLGRVRTQSFPLPSKAGRWGNGGKYDGHSQYNPNASLERAGFIVDYRDHQCPNVGSGSYTTKKITGSFAPFTELSFSSSALSLVSQSSRFTHCRDSLRESASTAWSAAVQSSRFEADVSSFDSFDTTARDVRRAPSILTQSPPRH